MMHDTTVPKKTRKKVLVSSRISIRNKNTVPREKIARPNVKKLIDPHLQSSPLNSDGKNKVCLNIGDSVASLIPQASFFEPELNVIKEKSGISGLHKSISTPELSFLKISDDAILKKNFSQSVDYSLLVKKLESSYVLWSALSTIVKSAHDTYLITSKEKLDLQLTTLQSLQNKVNRKRHYELWWINWLKAQKAIDTEMRLLTDLLVALRGSLAEAGTDGLLELLMELCDSVLLPASHRLPVYGLRVDSLEELCRAAESAGHSEERFHLSTEGERIGLQEIAHLVNKIADKLEAEILPHQECMNKKLLEASQLLIQLVSLKAHKIQRQLQK